MMQYQWIQLQSSFDCTQPLAVNAQGQSVSFSEFWQNVADKCVYLQQQVTTQYALWSENSVQFFAWLWAGVLTEKTIILPQNRVAQLEHHFLEQGIVFLDDDVIVPRTCSSIYEQIQHWQTALSRCNIIFFTSGSTGQPKQIPRSFSQLLNEAQVLAEVFECAMPSIYLASVSHQHLYGLTFKILLPFLQRQAFFTVQCIYPEQVHEYSHDFKQQGKVVNLVLSPALLKRCVGEYTFPASQRIFSSGGRLEQGVRQHYPQGVIEIFGSSETGAIAYRNTDDMPWQCLLDVQIEQDNQTQLRIKTQRAYQADWITMQDCVRLYSATEFELLGRSDRIIKLEEKRLSLDMIERTIMQLDDVQECFTLLITHGQREFLSAVVVLTPMAQQRLREQGKRAIVAEIKKDLSAHLETLAIPKHWRFVSTLVRNTQSKLNYQWVNRLFLNHSYPHVLNEVAQQQQVQYRLEFSPELSCFKGHFDGFPVYPGVGQIGFLVHFAQQHWHDLAYCCGLEQIKFQNLIHPYDVLDLTLSRTQQKISFKLSKGETSVASGRLLFVLKE